MRPRTIHPIRGYVVMGTYRPRDVHVCTLRKEKKLTFTDAGFTVKKFDEVVQHLHLVTQDQFSLVSEKDSGIPEDNFKINIDLFRLTISSVELLCCKHIPNVELLR
jgi:hypothetical protein